MIQWLLNLIEGCRYKLPPLKSTDPYSDIAFDPNLIEIAWLKRENETYKGAIKELSEHIRTINQLALDLQLQERLAKAEKQRLQDIPPKESPAIEGNVYRNTEGSVWIAHDGHWIKEEDFRHVQLQTKENLTQPPLDPTMPK